MHARSLLAAASVLAAAATLAGERFVEPPGTEPPDVAASIERVDRALAGGASVSAVLSDPQYLALHSYPRFRELIRRSGTDSSVTIVTPDEPGVRLTVVGRVIDAAGRPLAGAHVYAYQTSAKGLYAESAAHFQATSGDERHARLFGYLVTDAAGAFEIRTIRPAGYPGSDLPAHIHVHIARPGEDRDARVTEILFDDDARLTDSARTRAREAGFVIVPTEPDGQGQRVKADLVVR